MIGVLVVTLSINGILLYVGIAVGRILGDSKKGI